MAFKLRGPSHRLHARGTATISGAVSVVMATDQPVPLGATTMNARGVATVQGALDILPHTTSTAAVTVESFAVADIDGGSGWNTIYLTNDDRILLHSNGDHSGKNGRPRAITISPLGEELLWPYAWQVLPTSGPAWPVAVAISAVTLGNPTIVHCSGGHGITAGMLAYTWPDATVGGLQVDIRGALGLTALNTGYYAPTIIDSTRFSIPLDSSALSAYTGGGTFTLMKPGYGAYSHDNTTYIYIPTDDVLVRVDVDKGFVFDVANGEYTHGNALADTKEWPTGPFYNKGTGAWMDSSHGAVASANGELGDGGRNSCAGWCADLDIAFTIGTGNIAGPYRCISIYEKTGTAAPYWEQRSYSLPHSVLSNSEQMRNMCAVVGKFAYFGGGSLNGGATVNKQFHKVDLEAVMNTPHAPNVVLADAVVTRLADLPDKVAQYYSLGGNVVAWGTAGATIVPQTPPWALGGSLTYDSVADVLLYVGRYACYVYNMADDAWVDVTPVNWIAQNCAINVSGVYHPPTAAHYLFGVRDTYTLSKIKLNYAGGGWTQTTSGAPFGWQNKHTRWLFDADDGRIYQCGGDLNYSDPGGINPPGYPAGTYKEDCRQDMYSTDPAARPFVWRLEQNYYHLNQAGRFTDQPGPYHPDEVPWFKDKDDVFWSLQGCQRADGDTSYPYSSPQPGVGANGVYGSFVWRKPGWEMRTKYDEFGDSPPNISSDDHQKNMAYDPVTHKAYGFTNTGGTIGRIAVRSFDCAVAIGPESNPWAFWYSDSQNGFWNSTTNSGIISAPATSASKVAFVGGWMYATSVELAGSYVGGIPTSLSRRSDRLIRWNPTTQEVQFTAPLPNGEKWLHWWDEGNGGDGGGSSDRCGVFARGDDVVVCRWYWGEQSTFTNGELSTWVPLQPGEKFIFVYHPTTNTWTVEDPAPAAMGPNAGVYVPTTDELIMFGYSGFSYDSPTVLSRVVWAYKFKT